MSKSERILINWEGFEIIIDDNELRNLEDLQEPLCKIECPECEYTMWLFPIMQTECWGCGHLWKDRLWRDAPPGFWDNHPATLFKFSTEND
jgi:hypothetical protein